MAIPTRRLPGGGDRTPNSGQHLSVSAGTGVLAGLNQPRQPSCHLNSVRQAPGSISAAAETPKNPCPRDTWPPETTPEHREMGLDRADQGVLALP